MYKDIGQREGCSWVLEKSMRIYLLRESNYWSQSIDGAMQNAVQKNRALQRGEKHQLIC